jgi:hypothetical protein
MQGDLMTNGDVYRLRIKGLEKRIKVSTRTDRAVLERKKKALSDMAEGEDWLDGKLIPQPKPQR